MSATFQELAPLLAKIESMLLEGAPQDVIDAAIEEIRVKDPDKSDEMVQDTLQSIAMMRGELTNSLLADHADQTLDEVDKDSWDYNGEDGKPSSDQNVRSRRLTAYAKRQRN